MTRTADSPGFVRVTGPLPPTSTTTSSRAIGAPPGKVSSPPSACSEPAAISLMRVVADPISRLSSITKLTSTFTSTASRVLDSFARITP
jgi:hypothetical protein